MSETTAEVRDEIDEIRAQIEEERLRQSLAIADAEEASRLRVLQAERDRLRQQLESMRETADANIAAEADGSRVVDTRLQDPATGVFLDQGLVSAVTPVADLTTDQLRDQLRSRDLPVSGSKTELITRLEDAGAPAVLVTNDDTKE